jgi:serine/threonine protein kinase
MSHVREAEVSGRLLVDRGPDQGKAFPLDEGATVTLGRGANTLFRLTDPHVSRLHCELRREADCVRLVDLSSSTGTRVNGANVQDHLLKDGDSFTIGKTRLRVELGEGQDRARSDPAVVAVQPGDLLGGTFEVGAVIARGQTGTVHMGTDRRDGKPVAIKFLHGDSTDTDEQVARFVRAMKTVVGLRHPNLIAVHGAGRSGRRYWVAMEYVPGESLTQVIARIGAANMLDWRVALRVAYQVAGALDAAYEKQIIHRNISPRNILVRRSDEAAKLGDLMLAKATDGLNEGSVTRPGQLVGTVAYMAPERTGDESACDIRSDLYALGATLYALLTGRPPFEGTSLAQTLLQIRTVEPVPPKKYHLAVPDLLEGVVLRLLAKRPDDRHETPNRLQDDLLRLARFHDLRLE